MKHLPVIGLCHFYLVKGGYPMAIVLALTALVFVRALGKPKAGDDRLTDG